MDCFNEKYAELYDFFYANKDYASEVSFVESRLNHFGQYLPCRILDFGAGTGNHSLELASRGYEVTAVEIANSMRTRFEKKAFNQELKIDIRNRMPSDQSFDVIASMFAVMNYLDGTAELLETLSSFRTNLKSRGLLALDMWNGAAAPTLLEKHREKVFETPQGTWNRISDVETDWVQQRVTVNYRLEKLPDQQVDAQETHRLSYYTPREMSQLLLQSGFKLLEVLPSFETRQPTLKDFNLLFIARRAD